MSRPGRIHRAPLALAGLLTLIVGIGGTAGVYFAAEEREQSITRVEMESALAANDGPAENYLLVGSDSRAGIGVDLQNPGVIGDESDFGDSSRSDTIMILRRHPEHGASLLSIPRDLWVTVAGTGRQGKINGAFNGGPQRLAETITQELGIPIHHYVEIDFGGFMTLVDRIGGVEICVDYVVRDTHSGLHLEPGCQVLRGEMALAFTRSRYYEEFRDGDWVRDPSADFGRMERQQQFLEVAARGIVNELVSDPLRLGNLLDAALGVVVLDENTNGIDAGQAVFAAAREGIHTYQLPARSVRRGGQSAVELIDGSEAILEYFRGIGPLPPPPTTEVGGSD